MNLQIAEDIGFRDNADLVHCFRADVAQHHIAQLHVARAARHAASSSCSRAACRAAAIAPN